MVPYADLINHSPFSQAYIDARESGDWLFKTGEEEAILFADRAYRRMEQVKSRTCLPQRCPHQHVCFLKSANTSLSILRVFTSLLF